MAELKNGINIAVVGAGISGLSVAKMLSNRFNVMVLEKNISPGGLIQCSKVNDNLFHKVGGHVFNSKNQSVLDWFWSFFDKDTEFLSATRNAAIYMNDTFIKYPIENALHQLPEKLLTSIVKELIHCSTQPYNERTDNFKDFLVSKFGSTLYDLYFGPYNSKIWKRDLSQIPISWLDGKLPAPNVSNIFLDNILRKQEMGMVHSTFFYPRNDGSQFIVDRLKQELNLKLSLEVTRIEQLENKKLLINNGHFIADEVIYCGDIRNLYQHLITNEVDEDLNETLLSVRNLPTNGTTSALCETDETNLSWLYLPEAKYKPHRIIYTGNFSPQNNNHSTRKTCVVEFSGYHSDVDIVKAIKALPGNLLLLASNYEPDSYIIHEFGTEEKMKKIKALLKPYRVHLLGRFAEWQYYNMDKCIESAMSLSQELFRKYE